MHNDEIMSIADFVARLDETAELVITADPTTFTDERVTNGAIKLAKAIEGALHDGRTITGEHKGLADALKALQDGDQP